MEHALNLIVDDWRVNLDQHKSTLSVFLDLRKAFDTVDHSILTHKLSLYKFDDALVSLLSNYLSSVSLGSNSLMSYPRK